MTNETAIRAVSAHAGHAVATGLGSFAPFTAGNRATVVGTIGLPQGTYGTESVLNATLALQAPAVQTPPGLGVTAQVGEGRTNHPADVRKVQQRLADLGFPVLVDGLWGEQTRWFLKLFAAISDGLESVELGVGALGPGTVLDAKLADPNAPRWVQIAEGGIGWQRIDTDGYSWACDTTVAVLNRAGRRYQQLYRQSDEARPSLMVNDVSRSDGSVLKRYGKDEHLTHRTGLDIDLRLPRKPGYGGQTGTKTTWESYDREATYAMVEAFASDDRVERVIIYDRTLREWAVRDGKTWADKLLTNDRTHRDHLHIDVRSPGAT